METHREQDSNGFLIVRNNPIAKAGVFDYLGSQVGGDAEKVYKVYRPFEELQKAKDLFTGKPIMLTHKWVDPDNPPQIRGAVTGEIIEEEPYLKADLTIYDTETIKAIESEEYRELSPAYIADYIEESGEYAGIKYDYVQKNIRFNHLALVEKGRSGKDVRVLDNHEDAPEKEIKAEVSVLENKNTQQEDNMGKKTNDFLDANIGSGNTLTAPASDNAEEQEKTQDNSDDLINEILAIATGEATGGLEEKKEKIRQILKDVMPSQEEKQEVAEQDKEAEEEKQTEEKADTALPKEESATEKLDQIETIITGKTEDEAIIYKNVMKALVGANKAYDDVKKYTGTFNIYTEDSVLSEEEIYQAGYLAVSGKSISKEHAKSAFNAYILASGRKSRPTMDNDDAINDNIKKMIEHIK